MFSLLSAFLMMQEPPASVSRITEPAAIVSNKEKVQRGRRLATQNCQSCHAIGRTGNSTNVNAPKLRHLSLRYPIDNLSEAFAEGALIGHSVMPEFQFMPEQVDGLLAYIKSIQTPPTPAQKRRMPH